MSAPQSILDPPTPRPAGPSVLAPALRDVVGGYPSDVGRVGSRIIAAGIRFAKTRLLEVTVLALLLAWWIALASLVLRFMPLATVP